MGSNDLPKALRAEQLLELAAQSGVQQAEVYQSRSLSRPVFFEANRLKQLESSQSEGVALRLWREGCPGLAVAYGPVEPQDLVDRAVAMTYLSEPEPVELAEARTDHYPDLGEIVPVEVLVDMGREAIASIRDAYPEVLCTGQWECEEETIRLINSQGLDCHYTDTTLSCFIGAEWVRGEDFLSVYDGQTERGTLTSDKVVQQILQRLHWATKNVSPPSTSRVPVLLTAKAADLLWDTVQSALNGKQVLEGASPWSEVLRASALGDMSLSPLVTSNRITITQQPDIGPYSCPFDDEGTPTQPLLLIREGRLQQFYCDRTTGRLLETSTTGNGFRPGMGSYPSPGLVNMLIQPGTGSLADLISQLDEGLVVDQLLGGGAGLSGEFSVNVELGYRVQKGEITGRVKDTMITGNVYTVIKQLVALGDDADWNGPCYTPSLIVEGISTTSRS